MKPKLRFKEFINIDGWEKEFFKKIYKSFSYKKHMVKNKSSLQFFTKNDETLIKVYEQGDDRSIFFKWRKLFRFTK